MPEMKRAAVPAIVLALVVFGAVRARARRQDAPASAQGRMGPTAKHSVADLIRIIDSPNVSEEDWARHGDAIEKVGELGAAEAVGALRRRLRTDAVLRMEAAKALGRIGAAAKPAVPDLIACLKDRPARLYCIEALGDIGGGAAAAVPALERFVLGIGDEACLLSGKFSGRMPYYNCGYYAARALGKIGPSAAAAVPALTKAIEKFKGASMVEPRPGKGVGSFSGGALEWEMDRQSALSAARDALLKIGTPEALKVAARHQTGQQ